MNWTFDSQCTLQTHGILGRYLTHQEWRRATHTIRSFAAASCVGVAKSVALQSCKQVFKHPQVSFPHCISSYCNLHNTDLEYATSFLLCCRLRSNQLRPQVQLRPAPLCRGRLLRIHNKTLSLYAEPNGLSNRSPCLCLLLSCSNNAH